jgi:Protein of unknown function (DUF2808)
MSLPRSFRRRAATGTAVAAALGLAGIGAALSPLLAPLAAPPAARAQGTPGLVEFRWDNSKDYRKLYFFMTDTARLKRSEYYLILKPKDRKTAILKLTVGVPKSFELDIEPKFVQLCYMKEGGMLARTRCEKQIPAVVEVAKDGTAIEIFPETPVPVGKTIGVYLNLFNPFNAGMYQFNALAQAPGDVPISGYLGSWLIQIDPPNN